MCTREPDRDGQPFFAIAPRRRQHFLRNEIESGAAQPADHLFAGNAETSMRLFLAKLFKLVRREIDDQQAATGFENAGGLGECAGRLIEIVKNLMDGDEVGIVVGEGEREDIAMAHLQMAQSRIFDRSAGDGQHLAARINADAL